MEEEIIVPRELEMEDVLVDPVSVEVVVGNKKRTFWVRPPTDMEQDMARVLSRRRSRELRTLLEDDSTEEHDLLVRGAMEEMTLEEKRLIWLTFNLYQKTYELSRLSLENREEFYVAPPEGKQDGIIPPTNKDMDEYEDAKQDAERDRLGNLQQSQNSVFAELKREAQDMSGDDLDNAIQPILIEQRLAEEANNQYGLQVLVRCTFNDKDCTNRSYETPEQALRLLNTKRGKSAMERLLAAHSALMMDADQLKN